MGEQTRGYRRWGLALLGDPLANGLPIKDAALKIHIRATGHGIWGRGRNRACPSASVQSNQDEASDMAKVAGS